MINLILAHDDQGGIGYKSGLPWPKISEDMKLFRKITLGHSVLMGRKTFDSLGKPLLKRKNIVLTRDDITTLSDITYIHDLKEFLETVKETVFIIGGACVFEQAFPYADEIFVTRVKGIYPADVFYKPDLSRFELTYYWVSEETYKETGIPLCQFCHYVKQ